MSGNKTKPTKKKVEDFLNSVENPQKRADSFKILEIMGEITGEKPVMWGDSIVGFGDYHYKYKSGREGDWFRIGFSPRKQNLTLYLMIGLHDNLKKELENLGKHKTGKGCLYINKLADINVDVLKTLIRKSDEGIKNYRF